MNCHRILRRALADKYATIKNVCDGVENLQT